MKTPGELFTEAGLPYYEDRWFVAHAEASGQYGLKLDQQDEQSYLLTLVSGGKAELIHTEAHIDGPWAEAIVLATISAFLELAA